MDIFNTIKSWINFKGANKKNKYKKVIIDNKDCTEEFNKKKNTYNFDGPKKIIIHYSGKRVFNTIIHASSHAELNSIITDIENDTIKFPKKIYGNNADDIIEVTIITKSGENINLLDKINMCVIHNNTEISFKDICLLHNYNDDIDKITIVNIDDELKENYDESLHKLS